MYAEVRHLIVIFVTNLSNEVKATLNTPEYADGRLPRLFGGSDEHAVGRRKIVARLDAEQGRGCDLHSAKEAR